jgi:hypothetical protein
MWFNILCVVANLDLIVDTTTLISLDLAIITVTKLHFFSHGLKVNTPLTIIPFSNHNQPLIGYLRASCINLIYSWMILLWNYIFLTISLMPNYVFL